MTKTFPTTANIVIIGGGAIGTSIAYHLARAGVKDVILLEKSKLTEGATWHAAGLVGQFRSQQNLMSLMNDSVKLFDTLLEDTGQDPSWCKVGSMRIASSPDRWKELQKSYSSAQAVGFEMNVMTPAEAKEIYPLMKVDDLIGAAFIPDDGHIDPNSLTQAYAKGIRKYGGRILEEVMVKDLVRDGRRITQVVTDHGNIEAGTVVNAGGLWARQVGWMAGVEIPAGVVEHQYLVTEKTDAIPNNLPAFRDPDGGYYAKPEPGALAIGGWEKTTRKVNPKEGFPWSHERHLFDADMDRIEEFLEPAMHRLPILGDLGVRTVINGPIPISPDGEPVMGPVPGLENFFVACAFTSGIAASGGAGMAAANWIMHDDPGLDLWAFDIRRFGPLHAGQKFLYDRAVESYSQYYAIHWPGEELESARGVRRSPLYQTLKNQGAVFGSKFGWERANWFTQGGIPQQDVFGWDRPGQDLTVGREHKAAREGVVMIDMSSFTKFEISGRDACQFLQFLAVANVDKEPGGATYTQLCNDAGGIEADVTIIRRSETSFWLITGSGLGVRDRDWIERAAQRYRKGHALDLRVSDITSAYGVINLAGPLARKVLEKVTDTDVSNESFPFTSARDIRIGYASAVAYRVTYIGELGWELYIPTEYMQYVYEVLQNAGQVFGISNTGYRAVDSLRLEKRYLAWGVDISPDYNPYEAGLQFLIDWNKGDFLGSDALARIKENGVARKLVCLALEKPLSVFGGEAIFHEGKAISQTTSGNFGYSVGKSLVLGYVPSDLFGKTEFEVEAFGERSRALLVNGSAYDPERKKILC
ncbi:FAD-dependent oxidoreductase [Pseudohalocynthiibacter aestuariivivens]|jgi:glycine cleavage system aminomethyltransferase T/glycine/D-amino acid oxidase-like deaminating enzyme|uniref:FAD-dependent oxidoreductase n=1 Tax=Pseudohalocynthiibacter aestuariivivens TaxID=1591409 RepID=A0ABV5JKF1_9RHOB|nr:MULTISPECIES: FAD-dependent oxidoreductase [Pseudohalocynthiibacter]MBS9717526.1 FAD-dependent oxidoreductase [Pseudohalocynthiibacter aestuariivivens]MCK0102138.1 FAD-dependent oxidoreductase [Pseudohalocynthiibacter sp. F2068]